MNMDKITIFSWFITLLFIQWHSIAVESANTSEAKVTSAMQKTDNQYFAVVKDEDAKSGWAINVKQAISEDQTQNHYAFFYTRSDPKAKFNESFASPLCNLLYGNDGKSEFLPAQIANMIFPRQKGNCNFKVREAAIRAKVQVNTNPDDTGNYFPKMTPYEMEVQILNNEQALDDKGDYIFKVNFNIGGDINKK